MATLQWMHSDTVDVDRDREERGARHRDRDGLVMRWRDDGTIPDDRIIDVRFDDLVGDPWRHVRGVYERIGSTLDDRTPSNACAPTSTAKPRDRHGRHDYDFADTGLDLDETRARFAAYQARYEVPSEV